MMTPPRPARRTALGCLALALALCAGCSESPGSDIQGTVRFNGKPLPGGKVTFFHPTQPGRNVTGHIQPDGTYRVIAVPKGDARVAVVVLPPKKQDRDPKKSPPKLPPVPVRYADPATSDIVCPVRDSVQTFDIDLKS